MTDAEKAYKIVREWDAQVFNQSGASEDYLTNKIAEALRSERVNGIEMAIQIAEKYAKEPYTSDTRTEAENLITELRAKAEAERKSE